MLNELFQTKVNMMESVMKDLNTPNPVSQLELPPPTSQLHTKLRPVMASHVSESSQQQQFF